MKIIVFFVFVQYLKETPYSKSNFEFQFTSKNIFVCKTSNEHSLGSMQLVAYGNYFALRAILFCECMKMANYARRDVLIGAAK